MRKLMLVPAVAVLFAFSHAPEPGPGSIAYLGLRGGGCEEAPFWTDIHAETDVAPGKWVHLQFFVYDESGARVYREEFTGQGSIQIRDRLEPVVKDMAYYLEALLYPAKRDGSVRFDKRLDHQETRVFPCPAL